MRSFGHIDWIAFTCDYDADLKSIIPAINHRLQWEYRGQGMNGYRQKWIADNGAMCMKHGRPDMGSHVILSGSVLEEYRAMNITDKRVLQYIGRQGAHFSRIDVAIDVWDGVIKPATILAAYRTGAAKMPIKSASVIEGVKRIDDDTMPGITAYFGSRESQRMLRVYDKGVQLGTSENLIRFELELKAERARDVAKKIQDENSDTRRVINGELLAFVAWRNKKWLELVSDTQGEILKIERKLPKTLDWLLNTCAMSLAKYHIENPHDDALELFDRTVKAEIERLKRLGRGALDNDDNSKVD